MQKDSELSQKDKELVRKDKELNIERHLWKNGALLLQGSWVRDDTL